MSKFVDLIGVLGAKIQFGIGGAAIKAVSGGFFFRNAADSADAPVTTSLLNSSGGSIALGTTNILTFSQNSAQSGALTLKAPPAKATDGQVLAQKAGTGAGILELEFVSSANTAACLTTDTTSLAFGSTSPLTMFTLPANAVVEAVRVIVDTVFNGTPTLSIGVSGTASKYMASNQIDLKDAAGAKVYEVYPGLTPNGSSEALIATYSAGGASAGAARLEIDYVVPS